MLTGHTHSEPIMSETFSGGTENPKQTNIQTKEAWIDVQKKVLVKYRILEHDDKRSLSINQTQNIGLGFLNIRTTL